MSVCDSDMWKVGSWAPGYYHVCPCYSDERSVRFCGLEVFQQHDDLSTAPDLRPDTCCHAPALKAVLENPDLILTTRYKPCKHADEYSRCKKKIPDTLSHICNGQGNMMWCTQYEAKEIG